MIYELGQIGFIIRNQEIKCVMLIERHREIKENLQKNGRMHQDEFIVYQGKENVCHNLNYHVLNDDDDLDFQTHYIDEGDLYFRFADAYYRLHEPDYDAMIDAWQDKKPEIKYFINQGGKLYR